MALVSGFANLVADGFSMAGSNYEGGRPNWRRFSSAEQTECQHIALVPEVEREETRQLFQAQGFEGELVEQAVDGLCCDPEVWVPTMLREEYRLSADGISPLRSDLTTFAAFLSVGTLPLVPYALPRLSTSTQFLASLGLAVAVYLGIGMLKSAVYGASVWRSGLRTLLMGTAAAGSAFATGYFVEGLLAN